MAVYIKNVEMPKENELIYLLISNDGIVECVKSIAGSLDGEIPTTLVEMEQAKATYISEPHGRLIDADACIDYIRNNDQHAWESLAYAPTVIEESE